MKSARILIVEDEIIIAEHLARNLIDLGFEVAAKVTTGEAAIDKAGELQPDLILMDIRLRGTMDGIEAGSKISDKYGTPLIFITAYADDELIERAKFVMPYGYLIKPIQKGALKANVEMALFVAKMNAHRGRVENELRDRERWLQSTFQQAAVGIVHTDLEGRFKRANQRYCQMMGYTLEELLGLNISDITHPDFAQHQVEERLHLAEGIINSFSFEKRNIRKDGTDIWVNITVSIVTDEKGAPEHMLAIVEDITQRKVAENSLKISEEKYRTLVDNIPQRVFYKDADFKYITVNKKFADDFERIPADFEGKTDFDLFPRELAEKYRADDQQAIQSDEPLNLEEVYTVNGKDRVVNTLKIRKKNEHGETDGILGVFWNITDRIEAEKERKNLEQMLQQTQKMEAIGTLAGGIAHDFNNILHPIIGFSTLGGQTAEQDSLFQNYFSSIQKAGNRAKELVQQILTFSRQNEQMLEPVRLQSAIKEAIKMLRSSMPTTIKINTDIDDACGLVKADITQILQVVMNLATNAYHAMLESGGTLTATLRQVQIKTDHPGALAVNSTDYARLTISDTGEGMSPEVMEKIFDPYFTTKDKEKGTGLGLAVVLGIVKSHGGTIEVNSSLGSGTEFIVCFPITQDSAAPEIKGVDQEDLRGTERILVVDDEEAIVFFQTEALKSLGYIITGKTDSREAFETFKNNPADFDLMITDMTMPGLTGSELARKILEIQPDLPIILSTGFNETIDEEKATAMGIKRFLFKPIDQDELAAAIREVMDTAHDA
jgi:PAS domain S-box-containing protein